jgi:hypothetical protein
MAPLPTPQDERHEFQGAEFVSFVPELWDWVRFIRHERSASLSSASPPHSDLPTIPLQCPGPLGRLGQLGHGPVGPGWEVPT